MIKTTILRNLFGFFLSAALCAPSLQAQARDSARTLLIELRAGSGFNMSTTMVLERRVVYWAELSGPGRPVFTPEQRGAQPVFMVPIGDTTASLRRFEVYATSAGPHTVSIADVPSGSESVLRVYRDVVATQQIAARRAKLLRVGVMLSAGLHTGYRLDPTVGENPSGGSDYEGCLVAETGSILATCLGIGQQAFPDAGYSVVWFFVEESARLLRGKWLGSSLTDLGVSLRLAMSGEVSQRSLSPDLLAFGFFARQHLGDGDGQHGISLLLAWQHGLLGNVPETEMRTTHRLTAGLIWIP